MYYITIISSGRDEGRDDAASSYFLWKITRYQLHVRNTKLRLSTRQRCIKYLPNYQMPHWLKSTFAGNSIALQIQLSCIPTRIIISSPCLPAICPSPSSSASAESPSAKGNNLISLDIQNIQEQSLPTVCPYSFVTCWMKTMLMWKCCGFPWGNLIPWGAVGVPPGIAAVVRKALRSLWENCQAPPFALELAGEVVSLWSLAWKVLPTIIQYLEQTLVQHWFCFCSFVLDCLWQVLSQLKQ